MNTSGTICSWNNQWCILSYGSEFWNILVNDNRAGFLYCWTISSLWVVREPCVSFINQFLLAAPEYALSRFIMLWSVQYHRQQRRFFPWWTIQIPGSIGQTVDEHLGLGSKSRHRTVYPCGDNKLVVTTRLTGHRMPGLIQRLIYRERAYHLISFAWLQTGLLRYVGWLFLSLCLIIAMLL